MVMIDVDETLSSLSFFFSLQSESRRRRPKRHRYENLRHLHLSVFLLSSSFQIGFEGRPAFYSLGPSLIISGLVQI